MFQELGTRAPRLTLAILLVATGVFGARVEERETLRVTGLKQPAEIVVDTWGVPHLYAQSFDDAFFLQGFNAARDRLFQIDLWRRRGLGELAEVFGPEYVERDRAARLFLYRGDLEKAWAAHGPAAKRMATAFVAGVNAYVDWLDANPERMPIEFRIVGYRPAKWEAHDVVRIRSHGLTGNLTNEVARAHVVCRTDPTNGLTHDQVRVRLQPQWETKVPTGLDPCLPADVLRLFTLATEGVRFTRAAGSPDATAALAFGNEVDDRGGSNNWTIAPAKSATGRVILASDPHRAYSTPGLRYITHINAPGVNVIGGGEPALPGISLGHNGSIAFGLTRFYIDQEDLYVYELNPANEHEYRYQKRWEAMRSVRETIRVKGAAPVQAELTFTRHGPVIHTDSRTRRAYAVRSCWMEPGTAAYFGSASYIFAKDYREFRHGIARAGAPGLNYVYGDVKGNIAWVAGGLTPIRPNWDGLLPVPGDGRYEWAGFLASDTLPHVYNPSIGYFATANEMNLPAAYPYKERRLGFEWANGSRATRIAEVLNPLEKISLEHSMELQNDVTSVPARRLVRLLSPLRSDDEKAAAALELLRGWDAVEHADSAQAALFEVWVSRYLGSAFVDAILPGRAAAVIRTPDMAVMLDALEKPDARFGKEGPPVQRRDQLLLTTLRSAYLETEKLLGPDPKVWQWGTLHHSLPAHPLGEAVDADVRARLQPAPLPKSGGPFTPNQSGYRASDFQQTSGPSFRIVLDVGNWDNSRAVNYPGQSGNPDDPHYLNMREMWLRGEYFPLLYTRDAVDKATERRIVLMPR